MTLTNPNYQTILKRLTPRTAMHDVAFHTLGLAEKFTARAKELGGDRTLSEFGRTTKLRSELSETYIRTLREVSRPLRKAKADLESRRAATSKIDVSATNIPPDDLREIRAMIRSLPEAERVTFVMTNLSDPAIAAAVLTVSTRHQVGLSEQHMGTVRAAYLRDSRGDQLKAIDREGDEIEGAEAAARLARDELMRTAGLSEMEFNQLAAAIEAQIE